MADVSTFARAYAARYRLALVPIPPGSKGPRREGWNRPNGFFTDPGQAAEYWSAHPDEGIGAVLGPSGLCSLDVDHVEHARTVLAEFGIDLEALAMAAPCVVGNPERFRLLFAAPAGELSRHALTWPPRSGEAKPTTILELRAGDVQDVLPPTIHPSTGKPYTWRTRPNGTFPALPETLLTLWRDWPTFERLAKALCPWAPAPTSPLRARHDGGVIDAFNARHNVAELLEGHGYKRHGQRYLAPSSESGLAGVVILDGRCFSHHGADPLADGHAHDAFDVFRILDHGGDAKQAARAAAQELGLSHAPRPEPARAAEAASHDWPAPLPLIVESASEPYPLQALPSGIGAAVREVVGFVQCPQCLAACSALSTLSMAGQAIVDVRRAENLSGPSSLYLLAVAESGERKTTCDGYFSAGLREWEREQTEAAKPALAEHAAARQAWEATREGILAAIKQSARTGQPTTDEQARLEALECARPERPSVPSLIHMDSTPEALAHAMALGWPSGGVLSSEAGIVFGGHGMGRDSIMRNLALLNSLWEGGTVKVARRTSESFTLTGARFTAGLAAQPETVRQFFEQSKGLARGTGFAARFLIAWPESTQGRRPFAEAPPSWPHLAAFNRRIRELLDTRLVRDDGGGLRPIMLDLDPPAKAAWIAFHDEVERELAPGGELADTRDVASKAADNAARMAALFHLYENGAHGMVGENHLRAAAGIVAWHLLEARRLLGELVLPRAISNAAKLDAWLQDYCRTHRTASVPQRKARQFGPGSIRDKAALAEALAELGDADRARVDQQGRQTWIRVNPALLGGGDGPA